MRKIDDLPQDDDATKSKSEAKKTKSKSEEEHIVLQQQQPKTVFYWNGEAYVIDTWGGGRDGAGYAHGSGHLTSSHLADGTPGSWSFQCTLQHGVVRGCFMVSMAEYCANGVCNDNGVLDGMYVQFPLGDEPSCKISAYRNGNRISGPIDGMWRC